MDEVGSAGTSEVSKSVNVINDWPNSEFAFEFIEIFDVFAKLLSILGKATKELPFS